MNFDPSKESYPDRRGQNPALVIAKGLPTRISQDSRSRVFSEYLRLEASDRYTWESDLSLSTQLPRGYGIGLSLRDLDCEGAPSCELLVLGALRIRYEKMSRELYCSVHGEQGELATSKLQWTPDAEIDLFCRISENQLQVYNLDQRPPAVPFNTFGVYNRSSLQLQLGKIDASDLAGRFRGDVGRLLYWRDPQTMP